MLEKRSVSLSGHRTSIALEPEFWAALRRLAALDGCTLAALVAQVDAGRSPAQPLASGLRVFVLKAASRLALDQIPDEAAGEAE